MTDVLARERLHRDRFDTSKDTIASRFERQVEAVPDELALVTDDISLSYRELDLKASHIAAVLASLPSRDRPIALLMKDEAVRIAAMLGALKANRIFIPLAPDSPQQWITNIVEDSGAALILVDDSTCSIAELSATGRVAVLEIAHLTRSSNPFVVNPTVSPDDTAYIVYTSGSTGRPKGVAISHRRLIRSCDVRWSMFGLRRNDRVANLRSGGVASGVTFVFLPLLCGGRLYPF